MSSARGTAVKTIVLARSTDEDCELLAGRDRNYRHDASAARVGNAVLIRAGRSSRTPSDDADLRNAPGHVEDLLRAGVVVGAVIRKSAAGCGDCGRRRADGIAVAAR